MTPNNPYYVSPEARQHWKDGYSIAKDNWDSARDIAKKEGYWNNVKGQMRSEWKETKADLKSGKINNPWFNDNAENISAGISTGVAAFAGGSEMFNSIQDSINEYRDMEIKGADTEINGVPTYAGVTDIRKQYESIDPNDAGKGLIGQGAMTGAQVGMGLMSINPIVGGIATGVGALAGTIVGAFGKNKAKNEAEKAKGEARQKFLAGQESYNADVESYFQGIDTNRATNQGERNRQSRMYGLNQYNDPFRSVI